MKKRRQILACICSAALVFGCGGNIYAADSGAEISGQEEYQMQEALEEVTVSSDEEESMVDPDSEENAGENGTAIETEPETVPESEEPAEEVTQESKDLEEGAEDNTEESTEPEQITEDLFDSGDVDAAVAESNEEPDFEIQNGTLIKYNGYSEERDQIVVPDDVTTIGRSAFQNSRTRKVILGKNVRIIEDGAFQGSITEEIEGLDRVTSIGDEAFYQCRELKSVSFGAELENIGDSAFRYCENLSGELTIPQNVKNVGGYAFDKTQITRLNLKGISTVYRECVIGSDTPVTEISISGGTFSRTTFPAGMEKLQKVSIGGTANTASLSFAYSPALKDVTLSEGTYDTIGGGMFAGCSSLTKLEIPANIRTVEWGAFSETGLSEIDLKQVETLGSGVFSSCKNLKTIKMDKVTAIGQGCFIGCVSLKEIVFPTGLKTVGSDILWNDTALEKVTVTGAQTSFDGGMVDGCTNLKTVDIQAGKVTGWFNKLDTLIVGTGASRIEDVRGSIKHVVVNGGSRLSLSENAFFGIEDLRSAKISGKIAIPKYCFANCSNLSAVTLSGGITSVGTGAFDGTTSLKILVIPGTVTTLGNLFIDNSGVEKLTVPSLGTSGRGLVDAQISKLKELSVTGGKIGTEAFVGYKNLEKVTLGTKVTEIGANAFLNCPKLKTMTVQANVKKIGNNALGMKGTLITTDDGWYYGKFAAMFPTEKFVLKGYSGTEAEKYAKRTTGIRFVNIGTPLTGGKVSLNQRSFIYDGKVKKPEPTVTLAGKKLQKNTDYTVTYTNNKNIGSASIVITGKGRYSGKIKQNYTISLPKNRVITVSKVKYKVTSAAANGKGTVAINGLSDTGTRTSINIGSTVKIGGVSYRITEIGTSAFKNASRLKTVIIGANVNTIRANAFWNCRSLSQVTIRSGKITMAKTGANAFKGIRSNCVFKVPKGKNSLYKKILQAKGAGKNIRVTN